MTKWLNDDAGGAIDARVSLVGEAHAHVLPHGVDDGGQVLSRTGHILQHHAVGHVARVAQRLVNRHRVEQPVVEAQASLALLLDEVLVGRQVAVDVHAQQALRGIAVVEKGAALERLAVAHRRQQPLAVDFIKRDATVPTNRVDKPNVAV